MATPPTIEDNATLNADGEAWLRDPIQVDDVLRAKFAVAQHDREEYVRLSMAMEGDRVRWHEVHSLIFYAIDQAKRSRQKCVLVLPPSIGKSSIIRKDAVFDLAQDPRLSCSFVSYAKGTADRNLIYTRKTLVSPLTQELWPHLQPDLKRSAGSGGWSTEKLYLQGNMDVSFDTWTVMSEVAGLRRRKIIFDDAITQECQFSELTRQKVHERIHQTWLPRLADDGIAIFLNNCWNREDTIHRFRADESALVLWVGYVGFQHIHYEVFNAPASWEWPKSGNLPLWELQPEAKLRQLHASDRNGYKRLYEQRALVPEDMRFPPCEDWKTYQYDEMLEAYDKGGRIYAFLDPCGGRNVDKGDFAALTVLMIDWAKQVYLLDVWIKRASPEDQIGMLYTMHEKWKRALNGAGLDMAFLELLPKDEEWIQPTIQQFARQRPDEKLWIRIEHPIVHKNTRIDSLNAPLANGWLKVPWDIERRHIGHGEQAEWWRRLITQMEEFPFADKDDGPDSLAGAYKKAIQYGPRIDTNQEQFIRQQQEEERNRVFVPNVLTGKPEGPDGGLIGAFNDPPAEGFGL